MTDLDERGFGGSLSGLPFTSLHGNLIIDDDDEDGELFLWYGWPTKGV